MKGKSAKRHVTSMEIKERFLIKMRERKQQKGTILARTLDDALEFAFKDENVLRWF